ncbi:MAG: hypothetical protein Q7U40_12870 [Desulfatirhabdiaceae bacterium]|nr:hypothetical protein [Desulfatirhabdiaceae bacterium]
MPFQDSGTAPVRAMMPAPSASTFHTGLDPCERSATSTVKGAGRESAHILLL